MTSDCLSGHAVTADRSRDNAVTVFALRPLAPPVLVDERSLLDSGQCADDLVIAVATSATGLRLQQPNACPMRPEEPSARFGAKAAIGENLSTMDEHVDWPK